MPPRCASLSVGSPRPSFARIRRHMGLAAAITSALCLWLVGWALGAKAVDSFMVALIIMIVAVTVHMLSVYSPSKRQR